MHFIVHDVNVLPLLGSANQTAQSRKVHDWFQGTEQSDSF